MQIVDISLEREKNEGWRKKGRKEEKKKRFCQEYVDYEVRERSGDVSPHHDGM